MGIASTIAGLIFGNNPLKTVGDALNTALATKLNAKTESEKIEADRHIGELTILFNDLSKARDSAKTMPWWLAIPMGMLAFTAALHGSAVFLGSLFAPLLDRAVGLGSWLLNIPEPPGNYANYQAEIVIFFFGGAVVLGVTKAVTSAFGRK